MFCYFFYLADVYGGAEQRLSRIFNRIAQDNLKIDLLIIGRKQNVDNFIKRNILDCKMNVITCGNIFEAAVIVLKNRYKIICFNDSRIINLPILLASVFSGSKRIMTIAYTKLSELSFEGFKDKLVFNFTISLSDHIDVLYPSKVKYLKDKYPQKTFTATPNSFTYLNEFIPSSKNNTISFVGRLVNEKNPKLFLKSIELCQNVIRQSQYTVNLCGDGPEYDSLVSYAKEVKIDDIVCFKGYVDPKEVLKSTSVFMSIQSKENYPSQSLLEAISCGCYIIASNVGDTNLIVKEKFGCLVELRAHSISVAIQSYINKKQSEKNSIVLLARNFAVENFDIDQSYHYFKKLLFDIGERT